ncbi:MAG TPA: alcohol dehydrogenase [Euryarchaeota archaeon]|nr:alcohol dehydrogenase [Euryarchaeota archaeon]
MYYRNSDIRLEEMAKPEPGPGEMLVKVVASGICGSDVMEWYRIKRAPLVLGHEIAGDIEEVGEGVKPWRRGDRVVVTHHVPCGSCSYCSSGHGAVCDTLRSTNFAPGGFSEFVRVPEINVQHGAFALPDDVSYEKGSFVEPLGCVVRSMRLAELKRGQSVLVLGSGIAGILNIKLARALGADEIIATDLSDRRLRAAERFGADHTMKAEENVPSAVREITGSEGADLVIVATGAFPAFQQAVDSVDRGGTVMFFAPPKPDELVPLPVNRLWRNEVRLMTSYAATPSDLKEALERISSGEVEVEDMITHRLPLSDTQKGFQLVEKGDESLKVIIEPQR